MPFGAPAPDGASPGLRGAMTWPSGAPAFASPLPFLAAFGAAFALYWAVAVRGRPRLGWRAVLALGLLARLCLLPLPPSDDVARFLWEGRLLLEGLDPYAAAPDHPSLADRRDGVWQAINHKDIPAIYPPLALGFFAAVVSVHPSVLALKLALILLDVLGLWVLARAARAGAGPAGGGRAPPDAARAGAIHFLNPLLILETAGHAHYESLPLLLSLACLWALRAGRAFPSAALLVAAVGAKPAALALLPLLVLRFRGLRGWWAALAAGAGAAALLAPGAATLGRFAGEFRHDDAVPWVLRSLWGALLGTDAPRILGQGLLAAAGLLAARRLRDAAPEAQGLAFLALLLAFSPTVHPWYALWLLPFAALAAAPAAASTGAAGAGARVATAEGALPEATGAVAPAADHRPASGLARPALLLTGTLAIAYLAHARAHAEGAWREIPWLRFPEYLPPLALWGWAAWKDRRDRRATPEAGPGAPAPTKAARPGRGKPA